MPCRTQTLFRWTCLAWLLLLAVPRSDHGMPSDSRHRTRNLALLGVVSAPATDGGARVLQVLPDSPALRAGLREDDVLFRIGKTDIEGPASVDAALGPAQPGQQVKMGFRRGDQEMTAKARLVARDGYPGDFIRPRKRGELGFVAPDWFGFGWTNLEEDEKPPTLARTRGKVVVIHCFQSW